CEPSGKHARGLLTEHEVIVTHRLVINPEPQVPLTLIQAQTAHRPRPRLCLPCSTVPGTYLVAEHSLPLSVRAYQLATDVDGRPGVEDGEEDNLLVSVGVEAPLALTQLIGPVV